MSWTPVWLAEPGQGPDEPVGLTRAQCAAGVLRNLGIRGSRFEEHLERLRELVGVNEASKFEAGIKLLGELLGFEAVRPDGQADPDGAWRDAARLWVITEAKTEERVGTPLSADAVRQANTHESWVENVLDWERPARAMTVIVSDKSEVDAAAIPLAGALRMCSCETIRQIAARASDALRHARAAPRGMTDSELALAVERAFADRHLDDEHLLEDLGARRISDG